MKYKIGYCETRDIESLQPIGQGYYKVYCIEEWGEIVCENEFDTYKEAKEWVEGNTR